MRKRQMPALRRVSIPINAYRTSGAPQKKLAMVIAMVIFILGCLIVSAFLLLEKGVQYSRVFAGLAGIGGTGGALEALRRLWKDYSQTDLLLILIQDAMKLRLRH